MNEWSCCACHAFANASIKYLCLFFVYDCFLLSVWSKHALMLYYIWSELLLIEKSMTLYIIDFDCLWINIDSPVFIIPKHSSSFCISECSLYVLDPKHNWTDDSFIPSPSSLISTHPPSLCIKPFLFPLYFHFEHVSSSLCPLCFLSSFLYASTLSTYKPFCSPTTKSLVFRKRRPPNYKSLFYWVDKMIMR